MSLNDAITSIVIGIVGIVVIYIFLVYASKSQLIASSSNKKSRSR